MRSWFSRKPFRPAHVHQAAGIVSEQLGVSIDLAFTLMADEAEQQGLSLIEFARRIVAREYRFPRWTNQPMNNNNGNNS